MDDETAKALKYLRLRGLLTHWDEYLALAQKQHFSPVRLLQYVLEQECKIKSEHARNLRLARARIPERFAIETYPFDRQPKLDKKKSCRYTTLSITCPRVKTFSGWAHLGAAKRGWLPVSSCRRFTVGIRAATSFFQN